jgi:hypothetical protein
MHHLMKLCQKSGGGPFSKVANSCHRLPAGRGAGDEYVPPGKPDERCLALVGGRLEACVLCCPHVFDVTDTRARIGKAPTSLLSKVAA